MITIAAYDGAWPAMFDAEATRLRGVLGALALRIEHVGSTAVPGLDAKPVIDIQVSVRTLAPRNTLDAAMARLGYQHMNLGDFDRVYPFFHRPAVWPSTHHVHLCEAGGEQEWRHLAFRDALRDSAQDAAEYAALKRRLAARHGGHTPASREAYALAKSGFVAAVLARAAPTLFDTPRFTARELVAADLPRLQTLCDANPDDLLAVRDRPPGPDAARHAFDGHPARHLLRPRRWNAGFFAREGPMIGVTEVVADRFTEGVWHIGLFVVAKAPRGPGVAQALYPGFEAWAAGEGARWLRLDVVAGHARAERFWRAHGWREVGLRRGVGTGGRTLRRLIKPLAGDDLAVYLDLVPGERPGSTLP